MVYLKTLRPLKTYIVSNILLEDFCLHTFSLSDSAAGFNVHICNSSLVWTDCLKVLLSCEGSLACWLWTHRWRWQFSRLTWPYFYIWATWEQSYEEENNLRLTEVRTAAAPASSWLQIWQSTNTYWRKHAAIHMWAAAQWLCVCVCADSAFM